MERLSDLWDRLTPREQRRVIQRVVSVGLLSAGGIGLLGGIGVIISAVEYRSAPRVSEYPRVKAENDLFRIAQLSPSMARVTLFGEPASEERRDVLWRDIFESLQEVRPNDFSCWWELQGKVHENPPSFIAKCK